MGLTDNSSDKQIGCGFTSFKEIAEVKNLIDIVKETDQPLRKVEKNLDRFTFILRQYQDQPHLLDPYLEDIIGSLLDIIKDDKTTDEIRHNVFKYTYVVMSVKTYKKIVTYLHHEVMDLVPVLQMLEKQNPEDLETWQTRYCLLIWLSIISKIPFSLSRLESSQSVNPENTIVSRILRMCKLYCFSKDSCSTAAVFLIANFLTRSDVKELYLDEMIMWCLQCLEEDSSRHGPLAVLASILKHSARDDLKPYSQLILDKIFKLKLFEKPHDLARKFGVKIVQRIGFVMLGTKLATWRYKQVYKPIALSPVSNALPIPVSIREESKEVQTAVETEEQDIPPVVEDIFEYLTQGLRDKTIAIRWSSAKGIARITVRLPVDLGDDVVGHVLELFSGRESDSAWHGGCVALAELGRRGLLLPHRLKDVIPLVVQALVYDEPRVYGSVVSIIRDSACYVCWSFARAFEPDIFLPYVQEVAAALLVVACFDREINCRRAASAAFQENVGRQGNFPHGIKLSTVADYFEVGVRSNAYLKISMIIAKYPEYTKSFIDHLVAKKINHWDIAIRELAAKALHNLTSLDPDYMVSTVLPNLVKSLNSIDLNARHGTVLAIAEILEALYVTFDKDIVSVIGTPVADEIKNIVRVFRSRGQFRGLGGELMKQACATLVKTSSVVHFSVHSTSVVDDWQLLLEECLNHELAVVRLKAAEAHADFFNEYYTDAYITPDARNVIVNRYLTQLQSSNQIVRIGFAQAIGHFPIFVLQSRKEDIVEFLIRCTVIMEDTFSWAESRKEALHSLTMVLKTLGPENAESWKAFVKGAYDCYLNALKDYTTDSRGDIGAWVRGEAMAGLQALTSLISQANLTDLLDANFMGHMIGSIVQQAVERIDRIRVQAGNVFSTLIHSDPPLPNIPHHDELKNIFTFEDCKNEIDWKTESVTFPKFVQMLKFPEYIDHLLRGIMFSVGGLTESLVKHSSESLYSFLKEIDYDHLNDVCVRVLNILEESHKNERMITSILAFLDRLFNSGCIQSILDDPNSEIPDRMLSLLKKEIKCQHRTPVLISGSNALCHLLQVRGNVSKKAFIQLSMLLCHKIKCIRKTTAERMFESFTLYGVDMDVPENNLSMIRNTLNSTPWDNTLEEVRPIRNKLCELMNVPAPVVMKKSST